MEHGSKIEKEAKKKRITLYTGAIFLSLIVMLIIANMLGYIRFPWQTVDAPPVIGGNIESGPLPGMSSEELKAYLQSKVDESTLDLKINARPQFENGSSAGDLLIANPINNQYDMKVSIYRGRERTGELLYKSGTIPPDHHIARDKLLKALPKGEYKAIAYLSFYDGDTHINTTSVNLTLVIKN